MIHANLNPFLYFLNFHTIIFFVLLAPFKISSLSSQINYINTEMNPDRFFLLVGNTLIQKTLVANLKIAFINFQVEFSQIQYSQFFCFFCAKRKYDLQQKKYEILLRKTIHSQKSYVYLYVE